MSGPDNWAPDSDYLVQSDGRTALEERLRPLRRDALISVIVALVMERRQRWEQARTGDPEAARAAFLAWCRR